MSATTPDVPLHRRTDRWVFRSGGESGRVSRAERRGEHRGHEARRACADASEKPDRPWHRTTSSSRIITLRSRRVKAFLSLGEFAHDATAGIFNDYVALQVWAGTPGKRVGLAPPDDGLHDGPDGALVSVGCIPHQHPRILPRLLSNAGGPPDLIGGPAFHIVIGLA